MLASMFRMFCFFILVCLLAPACDRIKDTPVPNPLTGLELKPISDTLALNGKGEIDILSSIQIRFAYDVGLRAERFVNSWLGVNLSIGLSFLRDQQNLEILAKPTKYEAFASAGEIRVKHIPFQQKETIQSELFAGFTSVGLSFKKSPRLPVIRIQTGIQSFIWRRTRREYAGTRPIATESKFGDSNPALFFQGSVGKSVPF